MHLSDRRNRKWAFFPVMLHYVKLCKLIVELQKWMHPKGFSPKHRQMSPMQSKTAFLLHPIVCSTAQWWAWKQLCGCYLVSTPCHCLSEVQCGCTEEFLPQSLADTWNKFNVKFNYAWQHRYKGPVKNAMKSHWLWLQNYLIVFLY